MIQRGTMNRYARLGAALLAISTAAGCGGSDDGAQPDATDPAGSSPAPSTPDASTPGQTSLAPEPSAAPGSTAVPTGTAPSGEGSGSGAPGDPAEDDLCTEERVGGELTVGVMSELPGLDPNIVSSASYSIGGQEMNAIWDSLVRWNPVTAAYEPHVAESLQPNDDGSVWTLTLREGVTFANGDPLDADAVIASIERFATAQIAQVRLLESIASTTKVDDMTVEFTLTSPWGGFPFVLSAGPGYIVNTAVAAEVGDETFALDPSSANLGPYALDRFVPGEELVLTARTDYWGGPVCIETLRFVTLPEPDLALDAFENGEIDYFVSESPIIVAELKDSEYPGLVGTVQPQQLMPNASPGAPGEDVRVRQAIQHAVDVSVINDRAFEGTANVHTALVPDNSPFFTNGVTGPEYDPALASELVDAAKADGWDGKMGLVCRPEQQEIAIAVEAMLEAVGMDVEVEIVPTQENVDRVNNLDFDLTCYTLLILPEDPWTGINRNLSSESTRTGYANPDFDAALQQLKVAADVDAQREAMRSLETVWNETAPGHMFATFEGYMVWRPEVHGLKAHRQSTALFGDAWIEQ